MGKPFFRMKQGVIMFSKFPLICLTVLTLAAMVSWLSYQDGKRVPESVFPADSNGDLLRDDVGKMIAQHFGSNAAATAATRQLARAWQQAVRQRDKTQLAKEAGKVREALSCALSDATLSKARLDAQTMLAFIDALHAQMFDSPVRRALWQQYEQATQAVPYGMTPVNPCDFDLAALAG